MSPSTTHSPSKPLSNRDINTSGPSPTKTNKPASPSKPQQTEPNKPHSLDYHRQMLQNRLEDDAGKHTYVSPSDTIMSPCTKKLAGLRGKRFAKWDSLSSFIARILGFLL